MNHVQTLSETFVNGSDGATLASAADPHQLGPMDYAIPIVVPTAVVYVYDAAQAQSKETFLPAQALQEAMSHLLNHYPHLTGRLALQGTSRPLALDRLGSGALFESAECSARLEEYRQASKSGHLLLGNLPQEGNTLLSTVAFSFEENKQGVPFGIKHTRFACGSVAVGITLLHNVIDGHGQFQLTKDLWTLYAQGQQGVKQPKLDRPPIIQPYLSTLAQDMNPQDRKKHQQTTPRYYRLLSEGAGSDPAYMIDPNLVVTGKVIRFTRSKLTELVKASSAKGSDGEWVSTFDALTGFFYQRITRARVKHLQRTNNSDLSSLSTDLMIAVNIRDRLGLSDRYIPNCLGLPQFSWPSGASGLASASLPEVSKRVHEASRIDTADDVNSLLHWIASYTPEHISRVMLQLNYANFGCFLTTWAKFGIYDDAKCQGVTPCLVGQPFTMYNKLSGLVYILEAGEKKETRGDLDVYLTLDERLWDILELDGWGTVIE